MDFSKDIYQDPDLKKFKKDIEKDPRLFVSLGDSLLAKGHLEEAITVAKEGVEELPKFVPGKLLLGKTLLKNDEIQDARKEFEEVLQINEDNALALRYLGNIYKDLGKYEDAEKIYDKLLFLDPMNKEIQEAMEEVKEAKNNTSLNQSDETGYQENFDEVDYSQHEDEEDLKQEFENQEDVSVTTNHYETEAEEEIDKKSFSEERELMDQNKPSSIEVEQVKDVDEHVSDILKNIKIYSSFLKDIYDSGGYKDEANFINNKLGISESEEKEEEVEISGNEIIGFSNESEEGEEVSGSQTIVRNDEIYHHEKGVVNDFEEENEIEAETNETKISGEEEIEDLENVEEMKEKQIKPAADEIEENIEEKKEVEDIETEDFETVEGKNFDENTEIEPIEEGMEIEDDVNEELDIDEDEELGIEEEVVGEMEENEEVTDEILDEDIEKEDMSVNDEAFVSLEDEMEDEDFDKLVQEAEESINKKKTPENQDEEIIEELEETREKDERKDEKGNIQIDNNQEVIKDKEVIDKFNGHNEIDFTQESGEIEGNKETESSENNEIPEKDINDVELKEKEQKEDTKELAGMKKIDLNKDESNLEDILEDKDKNKEVDDDLDEWLDSL